MSILQYFIAAKIQGLGQEWPCFEISRLEGIIAARIQALGEKGHALKSKD